MNVVNKINDVYKEFSGEKPNSYLVKQVCSEIRKNNPEIPDSAVYEEAILNLRTVYGYIIPIEEAADINDARPFLARTSHRGTRVERG